MYLVSCHAMSCHVMPCHGVAGCTHSYPGLCRPREPQRRSGSAERQHFPPSSPSVIQLLGFKIFPEVFIIFPGVCRLRQVRGWNIDFELGLDRGEETKEERQLHLHPESGRTGGGHLMVLTDTRSAGAQWSSVEQDIALVISLPVTPLSHRSWHSALTLSTPQSE